MKFLILFRLSIYMDCFAYILIDIYLIFNDTIYSLKMTAVWVETSPHLYFNKKWMVSFLSTVTLVLKFLCLCRFPQRSYEGYLWSRDLLSCRILALRRKVTRIRNFKNPSQIWWFTNAQLRFAEVISYFLRNFSS